MPGAGGAAHRYFVYSICGAVLAGCVLLIGCGPSAAGGSKPDVLDRLKKLYNLYSAYIEKNQRAPASEDALREFGQKLPATERADRSIGDDLDTIFTSPRDGKKFIVRYN